MSANNLHIWPRGEFMMTSLPNKDRTFTGNLFAPFHVLEKLKTSVELLKFYDEHFPDLLRLIGEQRLVQQFFEKEPQTLISIKVNFHFISTLYFITVRFIWISMMCPSCSVNLITLGKLLL